MRITRAATLAALTVSIALAACEGIFSDEPRPGPLQRGEQAPPAPPPPPTAGPNAVGLAGTRLEWEWQEDARPSGLGVAPNRLGVIVSDGRFLWLDPATGQAVVGGFIWPDEIRGETWGTVLIHEGVALVVAAETFQSELGDFPETRSRVLAFNTEGEVLWDLPELGDKHLYSGTLAGNRALIGTHRGFEDNVLAAYQLTTGEIAWRYQAENYGFEKLVTDGQRVYSTLVDAEGGGMAAYDLISGALTWAAHDPAVRLADDMLLDQGRLYVLTQPGAAALNLQDGEIVWQVEVGLAPEAGMVARAPLLYVVPAPTAGLSSRPGVLAINTEDGSIAWHALAGLVADPLAADGDALWAVVKDPEGGTVALSVLDAQTGLEQARLPLGTDLQENYALVADGDVAYVLGDSLTAYRIPRQ